MAKVYDVAVVGCGPAGLSAAINVRNRQKELILFGIEFCTPKLHTSPEVNNYLGSPSISGEDLRKKFLGHLDSMGITMEKTRVTAVYRDEQGFTLQAGENMFQAASVILATGVSFAKSLENEEEFVGKGLGYCATCDGPLYRGKTVALLSYLPEAQEEANYLAGICGKVYYVQAHDGTAGQLDPKVEVIREKAVAVHGNGHLEKLELEENTLQVDGVFIIRETVPLEQLIPEVAMEDNFIAVNRQMETNIPGLYAAGDCAGKPFQLAKSVGEGQVAALSAVHYVDNLRQPAVPAGQTHS